MRIDWTIERTRAPTALPVSIDTVKQRLNLPLAYAHHDAKLIELVTAATEQFESDTDRVCMEQTFALSFPGFTAFPIDLFKRPVFAVNQITYIDDDGASQTLDPAEYKLSTARRQVRLLGGPPWPNVSRSVGDAVTIEFVAGVPEQSQVPRLYVQAITLLVGAWFLDPVDEKARDPWKTSYHRLLMKLQQEKQV